MVNVTSSTVIQNIVKAARLQSNQGVPSTLSNQIVPVLEVNPRLLRNTTILKEITSANNPASATIVYTTPTTQDFYLTGFNISAIKDVTSDLSTGIFAGITVAHASGTVYIYKAVGITLTAQNVNAFVTLANPIKLERGTQVLMLGQSAPTAGTYYRSCQLYGYIDDDKD